MTAEYPGPAEFKVSEQNVDDDGFASIWNIAAETCDNDLERTRELAARVLGFLCKQKCDFVVTSSNNAKYLDEKYEQDKKVLHDWKPTSEMVDLVAQHAEVPFEAFKSFLETRKYKPDANYSPTRADRLTWFQELWNVG